ncbi:MAG: hypothetical protein KDJ52_18225 [Anaerolineae bacterium]|nr:hypothetical protein [Anaerolineae bacterium]
MLQKTHNRIIFGALIGAFGGSSFVISVYPILIGLLFAELSGNALLFTFIYTVPAAILWAIGGAVTGWLGKMREGAIVMGLCGLIIGIIISTQLIGETGNGSAIIAGGAVIGLLYGIPAGLLMAGAFRRAAE